jgi:rubredoxin---NAD+ reductase
MQSVVIVGSGLAGYSVAREVRKQDKESRILVVTSDDGHLYSKPMLSEALRLGSSAADLSTRDAEGMAAQFKGDVWTQVQVDHIDTSKQTLATTRGEVGYDKLVLALGAESVALPLDAKSRPHVFAVNDLCDYRRFRQAADGKKVVAVLGAGLIGCEFANDLVRAGFEVKVIDLAHAPLSRILPLPNSRFLHDALDRAGVEWHLGTGVQTIDVQPHGVRVSLTDGGNVDADIVLCAIGLRPRVALAREAGLDVARGIVVNARLQTSDPNVYALGDCAEINGLWMPYIAPIGPAAKVVAANLTGKASEVRYAAMPIVVKTPDCPTVVCPPPDGLAGAWRSDSDAAGVQSLFTDATGALRGFALSGAHAERSHALAQSVPMLM